VVSGCSPLERPKLSGLPQVGRAAIHCGLSGQISSNKKRHKPPVLTKNIVSKPVFVKKTEVI